MSNKSVTSEALPDTNDSIWVFSKDTTILTIRQRLKELSIEPTMTSTVVSYCFGDTGVGELTTYGTSTTYLAEPGLEEMKPQKRARIFQKSHYKPTDETWSVWYTVYENQPITEEEFYRAVLYAQPDRVLNFQHLLFTRGEYSYTIEINGEAGLTLLKVNGAAEGGEKIFESMIEGSISQEEYLWRTFSDGSYNQYESNGGDMETGSTQSDRKVT